MLKSGKIIKFKPFIDGRGSLVSLENNKDIPFEIKRIYYLYDLTVNQVRGFHAHKKLEQVIIAINGSCKVILDNAFEREEIFLNRKDEGLYLSNLIWREISEFSPDCIVIVLANDLYKEEDYIRNYQEFIRVKTN